MDVGYNGVNRLMHQEHFSRVYHGGSPGVPNRGDSIRNFGPETGVHIVDAQQYGNAEREHFLHRSTHGMLVNQNEHSVDEGQRFLNGGFHVSSVVNTSSKALDWAGGSQPGEMEEEVDNRGLLDMPNLRGRTIPKDRAREQERSGRDRYTEGMMKVDPRKSSKADIRGAGKGESRNQPRMGEMTPSRARRPKKSWRQPTRTRAKIDRR